MAGSLGSGQVSYHENRPIIHFGTPPAEVDQALLADRLRQIGFDTTERMP